MEATKREPLSLNDFRNSSSKVELMRTPRLNLSKETIDFLQMFDLANLGDLSTEIPITFK